MKRFPMMRRRDWVGVALLIVLLVGSAVAIALWHEPIPGGHPGTGGCRSLRC